VNGVGAIAHGTRARIQPVLRVRARRQIATIGALLAFGAAVFVVSLELWHGPTLLAISPSHGVDTGDLVVAPLIALALVLVRLGVGTGGESEQKARLIARLLGPLSAVLLGGLLLTAVISRRVTTGSGPHDELLAGAVVAAAFVFGMELVRTGGRWTGRQGRSWPIPFGLLALGLLLDFALMPSGTVFVALFLAVWFAATAPDPFETGAGWLTVGALVMVNVVALTRVADVMARADGGIARAAALGGVLLVAGVLRSRHVMIHSLQSG
jgi:hypothetical protein